MGYIQLKIAIIEGGTTQMRISSNTGIHPSRLSQIIRGWVRPTMREQVLLAQALNRPIDKIFADEATREEDVKLSRPEMNPQK